MIIPDTPAVLINPTLIPRFVEVDDIYPSIQTVLPDIVPFEDPCAVIPIPVT